MCTLPTFRWASQADYDTLGDVMFDAIRNGTSPYSESQREAWLAAPNRGDEWHEKLRAQAVIVAESEDMVLGFMTLAQSGYIDLAFIRPAAQGKGLFKGLFAHIADKARENNETRLWVHASLRAEHAFRAVGFEVISREIVARAGERLERCVMERLIPKAS
ncbi:putative acetyltransferase [Rhodoligotrophos appendicifer]|uniref:GNAT family N-acetyltransferase n=1 Tax=Rhodoligotrophos appendicifer TaxID=987056 RepID=UPI0011871ECB|nr:GNAT family N-acetyltransferase [Rhodoligotrophos appendicifer]